MIRHAIKPRSFIDPGVAEFFSRVHEERLFLSVITFGEIEKGITLLDDAAVRETFSHRLGLLEDRFFGRIVDVDLQVAGVWGRMHGKRERLGRKTPVVDTLIAATAYANGLVLVTGDRDFEAFSDMLVMYDPFTRTVSGISSMHSRFATPKATKKKTTPGKRSLSKGRLGLGCGGEI